MGVFCSRSGSVWLTKVCLQLKLSFLYLLLVCHKRKLKHNNHSVTGCGLHFLPLAAKSSILPCDFLHSLKNLWQDLYLVQHIMSSHQLQKGHPSNSLAVRGSVGLRPRQFSSTSGFGSHSTSNSTITAISSSKDISRFKKARPTNPKMCLLSSFYKNRSSGSVRSSSIPALWPSNGVWLASKFRPLRRGLATTVRTVAVWL